MTEQPPMLALEVSTKQKRGIFTISLEQLADFADGQGVVLKCKGMPWKIRLMLYCAGDFDSATELIATLRGEEKPDKEA